MKKANYRFLDILSTLLVLLCITLFFAGCKKDSEEIRVLETGTVTDFDNNVYKTIKIGNQWWMAENLNVKHFNDGTLLLEADSAQWVSDTSGLYTRTSTTIATPGLLYNWFAVNNNHQLAPTGWHIPSDEEWKELEKYLGMSESNANKTNWRGTNEGDKLKVQAPNGWSNYGNVWGTNESGFSALAGNCRLFNYTLGSQGNWTGFWWTSSEHPDNKAWYRYLDYKNSNVFRYYDSKKYGFSIRCVKD